MNYQKEPWKKFILSRLIFSQLTNLYQINTLVVLQKLDELMNSWE